MVGIRILTHVVRSRVVVRVCIRASVSQSSVLSRTYAFECCNRIALERHGENFDYIPSNTSDTHEKRTTTRSNTQVLQLNFIDVCSNFFLKIIQYRNIYFVGSPPRTSLRRVPVMSHLRLRTKTHQDEASRK